MKLLPLLLLLWLAEASAAPLPAAPVASAAAAHVKAHMTHRHEGAGVVAKGAVAQPRVAGKSARHSEYLPDPTKPGFHEPKPVNPNAIARPVKPEDDDERGPVSEVQSTKIADGQPLAIINGEVHKVGDRIGNYTLAEINADAVTLATAKRRLRLPVMSTLSKLIRSH